MKLSIGLLIAGILVLLLWLFGNKNRKKIRQKDTTVSIRNKVYALSDTEKMISELKASRTSEADSNQKVEQLHEVKEDKQDDQSENIAQKAQNSKVIDYSIGSFILEKKKKN
jgi:hypothetical protein